MDSFDNFQYDSASSYGGGIGVVDDNSSVYTATTDALPSIDFSNMSIIDDRSQTSSIDREASRSGIDDDFDAVLDDLKDEGTVDLPPHACRYATNRTVAVVLSNMQLLRNPLSSVRRQVSYMLQMVL